MAIKQSINLYNFELKKRDPWYLRASFFFSIMYLLIFLVTTSSLWAYYQKTVSQFALRTQKEAQAILKLRLEKRRLELKALQSNTQVYADLSSARLEYDKKQRLLSFLKSQKQPTFFSSFLENLEKVKSDEIQLNLINISNYGELVDIKGLAHQSSSVAYWLKELKKTPSFAGKNFEKISIEKDQESAYVRFEVVGQYD